MVYDNISLAGSPLTGPIHVHKPYSGVGPSHPFGSHPSPFLQFYKISTSPEVFCFLFFVFFVFLEARRNKGLSAACRASAHPFSKSFPHLCKEMETLTVALSKKDE